MKRHNAADACRQNVETQGNPICPDGGGISTLMASLIQLAAEGKMDRLDWQIVDALMFSDCDTAYAVSASIDAPISTVRRRMIRLRSLSPQRTEAL